MTIPSLIRYFPGWAQTVLHPKSSKQLVSVSRLSREQFRGHGVTPSDDYSTRPPTMRTVAATQQSKALLRRQLIRAVRLGLDIEVLRIHGMLGSIHSITREYDGASLVFVAAGMAQTSTMRLIASLDPGLSIDKRNGHGWTALHVAIYRGHVDTTMELAALGADTTIEVTLGTGLTFSCLGIANHFEHNDIADFLSRIASMKAYAKAGMDLLPLTGCA